MYPTINTKIIEHTTKNIQKILFILLLTFHCYSLLPLQNTFALCSIHNLQISNNNYAELDFICDLDTDLKSDPIEFQISNNAVVSAAWNLPGIELEVSQKGESVIIQPGIHSQNPLLEKNKKYSLYFAVLNSNKYEISNFFIGYNQIADATLNLKYELDEKIDNRALNKNPICFQLQLTSIPKGKFKVQNYNFEWQILAKDLANENFANEIEKNASENDTKDSNENINENISANDNENINNNKINIKTLRKKYNVVPATYDAKVMPCNKKITEATHKNDTDSLHHFAFVTPKRFEVSKDGTEELLLQQTTFKGRINFVLSQNKPLGFQEDFITLQLINSTQNDIKEIKVHWHNSAQPDFADSIYPGKSYEFKINPIQSNNSNFYFSLSPSKIYINPDQEIYHIDIAVNQD